MSEQEKDEQDKSETEQQTGDTGQQAKPSVPPRRGQTFGTSGAEKRG